MSPPPPVINEALSYGCLYCTYTIIQKCHIHLVCDSIMLPSWSNMNRRQFYTLHAVDAFFNLLKKTKSELNWRSKFIRTWSHNFILFVHRHGFVKSSNKSKKISTHLSNQDSESSGKSVVHVYVKLTQLAAVCK